MTDAKREAVRRAEVRFHAAPAAMRGLSLTASAVRIDARTVVRTGRVSRLRPYAFPTSAIVIDNPIIVVEVLSPSTAAIDHGRKLSGYFSLPSVQHYLILDPERRVVIHHKRGVGDAIETRVLTDGAARLDPPGFEVAVEALFPLA